MLDVLASRRCRCCVALYRLSSVDVMTDLVHYTSTPPMWLAPLVALNFRSRRQLIRRLTVARISWRLVCVACGIPAPFSPQCARCDVPRKRWRPVLILATGRGFATPPWLTDIEVLITCVRWSPMSWVEFCRRPCAQQNCTHHAGVISVGDTCELWSLRDQWLMCLFVRNTKI